MSVRDDFVHSDRLANIGLLVSMGLLGSDYSSIQKFGENPSISTNTVPEDVWEVGGLYNYDTWGTAPIVSLISDDAADTEPIQITGLDIDGNEVTQTITLTGTTRVALDTPLYRVYRMGNVGANDLAGTVYCYVGTGGVPIAADTRAVIDDGNNQTLMAIYTIPNKKVGFVMRGELGTSRNVASGVIEGAFWGRPLGGVFRIFKRVDVVVSGASTHRDNRTFPDVLAGLTDVKISVGDVSANDMGAWATFDILLVDECMFDRNYLASIGQVGYA